MFAQDPDFAKDSIDLLPLRPVALFYWVRLLEVLEINTNGLVLVQRRFSCGADFTVIYSLIQNLAY